MRTQTPIVHQGQSSGPAVKEKREISQLGKDLRAVRERIVASGEPLLSIEEFDREMAEMRGEDPEFA